MQLRQKWKCYAKSYDIVRDQHAEVWSPTAEHAREMSTILNWNVLPSLLLTVNTTPSV